MVIGWGSSEQIIEGVVVVVVVFLGWGRGGAPAVLYGLGQKRAFITWERFFVLGISHLHCRIMMVFFYCFYCALWKIIIWGHLGRSNFDRMAGI